MFIPRMFIRFLAVVAVALSIAPAARAQDSIVIAAGVDVTGVNALDELTIVPDRFLTDHIADTLLRLQPNGDVGPWLATSYRNVDPLTWELKLRQGVKFQNGETFDAESVRFFYETLNDPKLQSPTKSNHTFVKAVEIVAASRNSPTTMTSGLSRNAARRPSAKLGTSRPTWR